MNKKRKILFCLQTMVLGGVEKELITIIKKMSPDEYDITIVLFYISDIEIMKQIPSHVKVIVFGIDKKYYCASLATMCKERIKRGHLREAAVLLLKRLLRIGTTHSNANISQIPSVDHSYDVAVCFHIHSPIVLRYVAERVTAIKKIAWIHNDFFTTRYPIRRLKKYLNSYQEIIAVSDSVQHEFIKLCPEYSRIAYVEYNIVDQAEIVAKSYEEIDDLSLSNGDVPRLLTVGRFTNQKGFDLAIKAASILKQNDVDFKWFFIGSGEQEQEYRKLISEYDVEDRVIILGRKNNPYPYIKKCDIYIQPSRHEAYGLVVHEARILNKPIICSRFAGSEQIIDGRTGYIVPVGNVEKLANAIHCLLINPAKQNEFVTAIKDELSTNNDWSSIKRHFDE